METAPTVIEFDIRGQLCPSTLLTTLKEVNKHKVELRSGSVKLLFRTDNRDCTITIPDTVTIMGYGVKVARDADHYVIEIDSGR
ncbi:MAG TPA: sulfurtransferase TusA family protein [Geobacteraceae bacterium]|jgi:TusA-related sulfurtransferase|nr:sulfurtransferase TusA family protein [Geobacteraceae bacterium]